MEAQLHPRNNDLKPSVKNPGRGPRVEARLPRGRWRLSHPRDSQSEPVTTTVPHHDLNQEKESFRLKMRLHTLNVYTEVLGVGGLQLLIQRTHSSPQQNPSPTGDKATTNVDKRLNTRNERRENKR